MMPVFLFGILYINAGIEVRCPYFYSEVIILMQLYRNQDKDAGYYSRISIQV
jgi:hypothetical protein